MLARMTMLATTESSAPSMVLMPINGPDAKAVWSCDSESRFRPRPLPTGRPT
jgi:hypothetical protein